MRGTLHRAIEGPEEGPARSGPEEADALQEEALRARHVGYLQCPIVFLHILVSRTTHLKELKHARSMRANTHTYTHTHLEELKVGLLLHREVLVHIYAARQHLGKERGGNGGRLQPMSETGRGGGDGSCMRARGGQRRGLQ